MTEQTQGVVGGRAAVRRAAARATRRTRYLIAAVLAVGVTLGSVLVGNAVGSAATPPAAAPAQILRPVRLRARGRRQVRRAERPLGRHHQAVHHAVRHRLHRRHRPAREQQGPGRFPVDLPGLQLRLLHRRLAVPGAGLQARHGALELVDQGPHGRRDAAVQHRLRHLVRPDRDQQGPQHRRRDDDLAQPHLVGPADRQALLRRHHRRRGLHGLVRQDRPAGHLLRPQDPDDVGDQPADRVVHPRRDAARRGQVRPGT